MSEEKAKLNIADSLAKLAALLKARFPDYDENDPAASDRKLILDAKLTEAQMVEIYSEAFVVFDFKDGLHLVVLGNTNIFVYEVWI